MSRTCCTVWVRLLFFLVVLPWIVPSMALAATPAGYSEFYIPGDEDHLMYFHNLIRPDNETETHSVISVVAWAANTIVYYDHWEDGYDFDSNNPAVTADQIVVLANRGDSYTFETNRIIIPRNPAQLAYDGRDHIYAAGGSVSVNRITWPDDIGTVEAIGMEVYPVRPQLTTYIIPFGEDLAATMPDFERVFALIQATEDNTVVQFDLNRDGVLGDTICLSRNNPCTMTATQVTLNRGECFLLDREAIRPTTATLNRGTMIKGTETLQVHYLFCDQGTNYESRGVSAFPTGFWDDEYYAPVDGDARTQYSTSLTDVYLYNPHRAPLTINYQTTAGSGSFNVPANDTVSFWQATGSSVPVNSAAYFSGSDVFWGISGINRDDSAFDWSYALIPATFYQDEQYVGWAPGCYPVGAAGGGDDPDGNPRSDSGLFIAPVQDNIRVFVDDNSDGVPDRTYDLDRLQTQYVWDNTDGDMSGANIWATGPFTMAYGQNPDTTSPYLPSIDTGDAIIPGGDFVDLVLGVEKTTDPVMLPTAAGSQTTYSITVRSSKYIVDDVAVVDTLASGWEFVNDSATIVRANKSQVTGAAANPSIAGSQLTWPTSLLGDMAKNQEITITFSATNTIGRSVGDMTRNYVEATGYRTVGSPPVTQTFTTSDFVFNTFFDNTAQLVTKTSSAIDPLYPGDPFSYTVTVTNSGTGTLNNVAIYDPIPSGVSYVPGSAQVTFPLSDNVRDEFGSVAYTNNNGSEHWSGSWAETDAYGISDNSGPSNGFVAIAGNQLQLQYLESYVRDEFSTNSMDGNNGSESWSTNWILNGDESAYDDDDIEVENNRIEFWEYSDVGDSIQRTADVAGATEITVSFYWDENGIDNNDDIYAEYDDGASWTTINSFDSEADGTYTYHIAWNPANPTITLRFRVVGPPDNNEEARFSDIQISYNAPASGYQIQRTTNLNGAIDATLTFDFNRANLEAGDTMVVEINNGFGFMPLATCDSTTPVGGKSFDISSYISTATTIRYRVTGGVNAVNEYFSIDNVDIAYGGTGFAAANNPPNFISSSSGYSLAPGESLSLTFQVSVNDPLSIGIDSITNSACITADQVFVPICDEVTNIVTNPGSGSARVGDLIWFDSDRDGSFDVGEAGIPNVEVTLKDRYGTPISVTHTDGTGHYLFTGVALDNGYYVEVTGGIPAGLMQSAPSGHTGVNADDRTDAFDLILESDTNYRDEFTIQSYNNTDGSIDWSSAPWVETDNNGGGATGGEILITGGQLRINNVNGSTISRIQRPIDFPDDFTSATLRFDYLSAGGLETTDVVYLEISTDGVNFTNLTTYQQFVSGSAAIDIGGYASSNTIIRFSTNNQYLGGDEFFYVDNFDVTFTYPASIITEYLDADLGYGPSASAGTLGDRVWIDADGDASQDTGEPGLSGITVQLYRDVNSNSVYDAGDTVVSTAVTTASGFYLFTGIAANGSNDYVVFIDPAQAALDGYTATTETQLPSVDLLSGETQLYLDFGFRNPANNYSIRDRVWFDPDSDENDDNGTPDTETGISGVTVDLLDASRNVIATTITDAGGYFIFAGVAGGGADYTVRITDAGGKLSDYFGTTDEARAGELAIDNLTGNRDYTAEPSEPNFGYNLAGAIGDTLFIDMDGDGIQDADEYGISNVTVLLYRDVNGNGIFEPGGADGGPVATLTTDADGKYLFSGLTDATWFVHVDNTQAALAGYDQSTTTDDEAAAGHQRQVTITSRNNYLEADFGYRPGIQRSVSGTVWRDAAEDGVIDPAESRFANVTIELLSGTTVIRTTITDVDGYYVFTGLPAATYTVRLTDRNNVLSGYSTVYEVTEGLQKTSYDYQEIVNLSSADASGINFGYNAPVPTFALISSFSAYNEGGRIIVEWETSSEVGTAGFDLMRLEPETGARIPVNASLIPAVMRPQGGIYRCVDPGAATGSHLTYALLEREVSGSLRSYGPYTVSAGPAASALPQELILSGYSRQPREILTASQTRMPMAPASATNAGLAATGSEATRIRISLTKPGLYRITADEIAGSLGVSAEKARQWIALRQIRMTNKGTQVFWLPFADDAGLYFYGERHETLYSDLNVYWIDIGEPAGRGDLNGDGQVNVSDTVICLRVINGVSTDEVREDYAASGADVNGNNKIDPAELVFINSTVCSGGATIPVMKTVSGGSPAPVTGKFFETTIPVEQDLFDMTHLFTEPEADYWFWAILFAGEPGADAFDFPFEVDGMAAGGDNARLEIRLHGGVDGPGDPDHHARVFLNGSLLGEEYWNGTDAFIQTYAIDPGLFNPGGNTLRVEGIRDAGVEMSAFMVDGFDLTYSRSYDARDDRLAFTSAGESTITVSGFTGNDICLLELSDPGHPKDIMDVTIDSFAGKYRISFSPARGSIPYLAVEKTAAMTPDDMAGAIAPDLKDVSNAAAYLVITAEDLAEGALQLAEYRRGRGLSSRVATLDDIFDAFSDGIYDPHAISAFLAFAAAQWAIPPEYVVLVGDGTYDYKDHFLAGDNKVPVMMTGTPHGLFVSDNRFADGNRDGIPDIPIGRIPANDGTELQQIIAKIVACESDSPGKNILMVADKPDDGGNFPESSDDVALRVPPEYTVSKIYRSIVNPSQARSQIIGGINGGAYLVNYIGHGGYDTLGNPAILSTNLTFENTRQYPVLVALTCLAGGFSIPGFDSLSEVMIFNPGGFVAAWSPSGLSINNDAVRLNKALFTAIFEESAPTLGEAVKLALERYADTTHQGFMPRIYNLLGDPALELR